jgi:hypothetical protein
MVMNLPAVGGAIMILFITLFDWKIMMVSYFNIKQLIMVGKRLAPFFETQCLIHYRIINFQGQDCLSD